MKTPAILITFLSIFSISTIAQKPATTPDMLDKVLSAVVSVAVYETDVAMKPLGFRGNASDLAYAKALDLSNSKGSGSGFIIQRNGTYYVITNAHVVQSAASKDGSIYIYTIGNKKYKARIKGGDTFYDLAVLEFITPPGSEITSLKFKTAEPRIGEQVYAIGNPLGDYPYTVTDGIISAKNRIRPGIGGVYGKLGFIQSTATVIWGNSGGPLVDVNGDVVGVNSQIAFAERGDNPVWQPQINFALQSDITQRLINDIFTNEGLIRRAFLGVEISKEEVDSEMTRKFNAYGNRETNPFPVISGIIPGSPSAAVLTQYVGFTVKAINTSEVKNIQDVLEAFEKITPGQPVNLRLEKNGQTVSVKINTRASEADENASIGTYAMNLWGCRANMIDGGLMLNFFDRKMYTDFQKSSTESLLNLGQKVNMNSDVLFSSEWMVVGAGYLGNNSSQIWTVKDIIDLGTTLRLCSTNGIVDLVLFRRGSNPNDENNYFRKRFILSGNNYINKQTLYY